MACANGTPVEEASAWDDLRDSIHSLPVELRLPDYTSLLKRKGLDTEYAPKQYLREYRDAYKDAFGIHLHSDLDVVAPGNAPRSDYWAYIDGTLRVLEVEHDLYGFWNHKHFRRVALGRAPDASRIAEVDCVFAGTDDEGFRPIIEDWFEIPVIVADECHPNGVPSFTEWLADKAAAGGPQ